MIQRMWQRFRQWRCRHKFRLCDLRPRGDDGKVLWPCAKCGKTFTLPYGLDAPGEIVGPVYEPQQPTGEEG